LGILGDAIRASPLAWHFVHYSILCWTL